MLKHYFILLAFLACGLGNASAQKYDSLQLVLQSGAPALAKIDAYIALGQIYADEGKYEQAIASYKEMVAFCQKTGQQCALPRAYNEIGNAHSDLGNNKLAFSFYQKALSHSSADDFSLKAKIHKNLGAVFLSWKNLDQALRYYNQALELALEGGDQITAADCLNNKGTVFEQQGSYVKASDVYLQALAIYKKANLYPRMALTYNNLAILSKVTNKPDKASGYYRLSLDNAAKAGNIWLTAAISTNLGNLLTETGNLNEGERYLLQALSLSKKIAAKELIFETLENLAVNTERKGNYKEAYRYHTEFSNAKQEFINLENIKTVAKLQTELTAKYETVKKEKALANSQAAFLLSQREVDRKTNLLRLSLLGVLSVILLALLLYRSAKIKQHKLKAENELNLLLAATQARNLMQEEKARISRELHDNIGSQLNFINSSIQSFNQDHADVDTLQETQKIALHTIAELRRTVWFMHKQEVEVDELLMKIQDYLRPINSNLGGPEIEVTGEGNCLLSASAATNLFRIMQEGVNNALKYAKASSIEISVCCTKEMVFFRLQDNGIGFNLFVDREGYGLRNISTRAKALGGTCLVHSVEREGTKITVQFPL